MPPSPDIVIVGSGMGGATVAAGLAATGASILLLERGERLRPGNGERSTKAIFVENRFRTKELWLDGEGQPFNPGNFYYVGGNSKLYGAALFRFRREDFEACEHPGGVSPAWPFSYEELEPWYGRAEALYQVRGCAGEDPTEPPRSTPYPHPPVPDEPAIARVRERLKQRGLHPFSLPLGVDVERWLQGGRTPWDGHPDTRSGKMDAETCGLAAALEYANVRLETGARVERLEATPDGRRVSAVHVRKGGRTEKLTPGIVVLCAGAVNSAAILLRSTGGARTVSGARPADGARSAGSAPPVDEIHAAGGIHTTGGTRSAGSAHTVGSVPLVDGAHTAGSAPPVDEIHAAGGVHTTGGTRSAGSAHTAGSVPPAGETHAADGTHTTGGSRPPGLANRSGQVGRHFMNHNCSAMLAIDPRRRNRAVYQKTLGLNDFYLSDGEGGPPLGNVQLLGKIDGTILKANVPWAPKPLLDWAARRSVDWYLMSEDLPDPESRVRIDGRDVVLDWTRTNMEAHRRLSAVMRRVLKDCGYPVVLAKPFDRRTPSHQCGTVRIGDDPARSALDPHCKAWDHDNLYVADASCLPTSAAVNPALTVAALALRAADRIRRTELGA